MERHERKISLVTGALLILLGVVGFVETRIDIGAWIWVGLLAGAGLIILITYLADRAAWGLLIPAYVCIALAALLTLLKLDLLRDEAIAVFVLSAIATPFLIVWLRDRTMWPMLIPAYVLLSIAAMVGLIGLNVLTDLLIPAYVLLSIALPFFAVFLVNRQNWWALIPGGIMATIGIAFLVSAVDYLQYLGPLALIVIGLIVIARQAMGSAKKGV